MAETNRSKIEPNEIKSAIMKIRDSASKQSLKQIALRANDLEKDKIEN